jgi:hypothetical protein
MDTRTIVTMAAAAVAAVATLASCSELGIATRSVPAGFADVADPLKRWRSYNLSDYVIEMETQCFGCGGHYAIIVQRRRAAAALDLHRNHEYLPPAFWADIRSVDEMFAWIDSLRGHVAALDVEYDPDYGFPSRVYVDGSTMVSDDEVTYTFSRLRAIEGGNVDSGMRTRPSRD